MTDEAAIYYLEFLSVIGAKPAEQIYGLLERVAHANSSNKGDDKLRLIQGFSAKIERVWNPEKLAQVQVRAEEELQPGYIGPTLDNLRQHLLQCSAFLSGDPQNGDELLAHLEQIKEYAGLYDLNDIFTWVSTALLTLQDQESLKNVEGAQANFLKLTRQHQQVKQLLTGLTEVKQLCEVHARDDDQNQGDRASYVIQEILERFKQRIINSYPENDIGDNTEFTQFTDYNVLFNFNGSFLKFNADNQEFQCDLDANFNAVMQLEQVKTHEYFARKVLLIFTENALLIFQLFLMPSPGTACHPLPQAGEGNTFFSL